VKIPYEPGLLSTTAIPGWAPTVGLVLEKGFASTPNSNFGALRTKKLVHFPDKGLWLLVV